MAMLSDIHQKSVEYLSSLQFDVRSFDETQLARALHLCQMRARGGTGVTALDVFAPVLPAAWLFENEFFNGVAVRKHVATAT